MSNELGRYNASPPAAAYGLFPGDSYGAVSDPFTASAGQTLIKARIYGRMSVAGTCDVALYNFAAGALGTRVGAVLGAIAFGTSDAWCETGTLAVSLPTPGNQYVLAAGNASQILSMSFDAVAGAASEIGTNLPSTWSGGSLSAHAMYMSGDVQNTTLPTITSVGGDDSVFSTETAVAIVGANFGASQGSGSVIISPTNNIADGAAVAQTVTSWGASAIAFTVVKGGLSLDTNVFLFVTSGTGVSNATGKTMQINARVFVRETLIDLAGAAAASVSSIIMLVWRTGTGPSVASPNPNEAISISTNGSGVTNQLITRGSLVINDPIWVAFLKNGSPAKATLRKITPVYE